uniref:C-type lectin domain-containing protein n=1 Tax=Loa loa TaxID=7209 RepID=A0A1I7W5E4_LOALO
NTTDDPKLGNIGTADENICRLSSNFPSITSVSIRNKEEFEFVKMLYRTFERKKWLIHADRNDLPLLIGLTYINNNYHWLDNTPFNYDNFLDRGFMSNFSAFKADDCRRVFLYSPPTRKLSCL